MYSFEQFKNEVVIYVQTLWKFNLIDDLITNCRATEEKNNFLPKEVAFTLTIEVVNVKLDLMYKLTVVYSVVHCLPELLFQVYDLSNKQEILDIERVLK